MNRSILSALSCLSLAWALAPAHSQAPPPVLFETVDVEIVNVEVFVTDKKDRPTHGLGRDDFRLLVDGEEVVITNFYAQVAGSPAEAPESPAEPASAVPRATMEAPATPAAPRQKLHVMILIDNLHLRPIHRKRALQALRRFTTESLDPGDAVAVASLDRSLELHGDFSTDRQALAEVLDEIETTGLADFTVGHEQRELTDAVNDLNNTAGNAALDAASVENARRSLAQSRVGNARASLDVLRRLIATLSGIRGRKALIHVSDGLAADDGQVDLLRNFEALGHLANASRVTLYSIDAAPDHRALGRTPDTTGSLRGAFPRSAELEVEENTVREPLELTTATTGGRRLQMSTRLGSELERLASDFTTFYSLGFSSEGHDPAGLHRVEVELRGKSKGLRIRHRASYRPKPRDDRSAEATMAALLYNAVDNPLEATLEPGKARTEDGQITLPVEIKVPFRKLVLIPAGGVHQAQVSVFYSVRNAAGDARQVQKLSFRLSVPEARLQQALRSSAGYTLPMKITAGDHQAIVGVRDDLGASESLIRLDLPPDPEDGAPGLNN